MKLALILPLVTLAATVQGAPLSFDFKDPKGVNNAVFKLDAPLESINGSANGITGTVKFDPQNPPATTGKIIVTTASMTLPNPMQNTHMHGVTWLDAKTYPEISFEAKTLANVKTEGDVTTAEVTGAFSLHGVTKDITVPVKLTYLKGKLSSRVPGLQGDLLVLRADFKINRNDFNINKGKNEDEVSTTIDLSLSIAGAAVTQ